jgi:hypothetical protein
MRQLVRSLRRYASRHEDSAWVLPRRSTQTDTVANLGQDILDAVGAVG